MHGGLVSSSVIKDTNFELVTEFARTDAKKRLSLGEALAGSSAFNIYRNTFGQLFLDPVRAVPADEAWLFENPAALASVKRGLEQAARGEVHDLGDFSKHANWPICSSLKKWRRRREFNANQSGANTCFSEGNPPEF